MKKRGLALFAVFVFLALPAARLVAEEVKPRAQARPAETLWEITEKAKRYANTPESGIPMSRYFVSGAVYYAPSDTEPAGWDVTWKKNETGNDDEAGLALPEKIVLHFYANGTTRCDGCISMEPRPPVAPPKPAEPAQP